MKAARRDRQVYLRSHPVLFALLAVTRGRPVVRLGRRTLVHGEAEVREVLTAVPLDRTSPLTTGGAVRRHGGGALFDETGDAHRGARRAVAADLDARGVAALRPVWTSVLDDATARLSHGEEVDVAVLADDVSGRTVAALLDRPDLDGDACRRLAAAARALAAAEVDAGLPGPRAVVARVIGRSRHASVDRAVGDLGAILGEQPDARSAMLAVAAVATTRAALPRAVAWTADEGLWDTAVDAALRPALVAELLRVVAPTPVLPRVPAVDAVVGGCPLTRGRQVLLVARHAVGAHRDGPDPSRAAPAATAQLVFGAGPHACPGAGLARAQLADVLAALAPLRPVVTRARADRRAALPAWGELRIRASAEGAAA